MSGERASLKHGRVDIGSMDWQREVFSAQEVFKGTERYTEWLPCALAPDLRGSPWQVKRGIAGHTRQTAWVY